MQEWIEVAYRWALYGFGLLVLFTVGMFLWFLRWVFSGDPLKYFPQDEAPESQALRQLSHLRKRLEEVSARSSIEEWGSRQRQQELLRHWERRMQTDWLRARIPFYQLRQRRERLWYRMYELHQRARWWQRLRGLRRMPEFEKARVSFEETGVGLEQERRHLQVLDELHLSRLQAHPLYRQLPPR